MKKQHLTFHVGRWSLLTPGSLFNVIPRGWGTRCDSGLLSTLTSDPAPGLCHTGLCLAGLCSQLPTLDPLPSPRPHLQVFGTQAGE